MGVKNLEPYRHMCWIYILWHCRCSMDFPIRKTCSMDLFAKTFVFCGFFYLHRSQKTHEFPTVGPKELISIGIAIRPWRYRPVAAICTMVKLHGEKRGMVISPWWGILLMTVLMPANGGWITVFLWFNHRFQPHFGCVHHDLYISLSIPIHPYQSLSIPIHPYPYAYSISEPQE